MSSSWSAYVHCQWCFQKCTYHSGGLANHMWWSLSCQKLKASQTEIWWSHSNESGTPTRELTPRPPSPKYEERIEHVNGADENWVCAGLKMVIDADAGKPLQGWTKTLWDKMMGNHICHLRVRRNGNWPIGWVWRAFLKEWLTDV